MVPIAYSEENNGVYAFGDEPNDTKVTIGKKFGDSVLWQVIFHGTIIHYHACQPGS